MQQGGSRQYGVPLPEMSSFGGPAGTGSRAQVLGIPTQEQQQQQQQQPLALAEAASPISSRPPQHSASFDELATAVVPGGFPNEDALAAAGEEAERGGVPGNRWPRQETLALLKIRSDMDAAFRDATLKGPLWEEVSRKLAEMGYRRSAKKCKEKFENVHKYYKRTKDGRAGRQDGKTYRFFTQLEALHSSGGGGNDATTVAAAAASATPAPAPIAAVSPLQTSSGMLGSSGRLQPTPLNSNPPPIGVTTRVAPDHTGGTSAGLAAGPPLGVSFSSDTASSSASESEGEDTEEGLPGHESGKRKHRGGGGGGGSRGKMMSFFEGLMKQVMERQEAMQQRFLETIEKREQDRMIREEAWKRQEMARLNHEHEMMAHERAISASRDAAIIAFLQKVTGQTVPVPSTVLPAASVTPPPPAPVKQPQPPPAAASAPPPQPQPPAQQQTKQHIQHQGTEIVCAQASPVEVGPVADAPEAVGAASGTGGAVDPASSRWPKAEVHALIKIRSGLECRYQEAGPKGPLWEEIAGQMQRMGYNRSSKRCKEKWENINKYFKKVKESNKRRPEDSKTCPYFHQLDALYRNKKAPFGAGTAAGSMIQTRDQQLLDQLDSNSPTSQDRPAHAGLLLLQAPPLHAATTETEGKDGGGNGANRKGGNPEGNGGSSSLQMRTSNGGFATSFFDEEPGSAAAKKPEGIVKGLMDQQQHHQKQQRHAVMEAYKSTLEEPDSDNMDVEEDDEDDDEDSKTAYKIQYQQRPGVSGGSNGGGNQTTTSAAAVAAAAAAGSSFMAMVQ